MECRNLTAVRISKNVKKVEHYAFNYTNIVSATLPEGINLSENSFYFRYDFTSYYAQSVDLSKIRYRHALIEYNAGYDNDFPYVKYIKSNFMMVDFGDTKIERSEYLSFILSAPEREGYVFKGWSKNEDCKSIDYPVNQIAAGWDKDHSFYYLEAMCTYNPFYQSSLNKYYDPDINVLYAAWEKI